MTSARRARDGPDTSSLNWPLCVLVHIMIQSGLLVSGQSLALASSSCASQLYTFITCVYQCIPMFILCILILPVYTSVYLPTSAY